ncbi:hypothetical protein QQF64_030724 [Cirrhinus molitorella]|uniref:Uncharacterized protein n=1 Tax=Cirrhinus molitorella TaxID=172907 RepID=A0ABR3N4A6_9TELE
MRLVVFSCTDLKRSYMRSLSWSRLADPPGVLQPPCLFIHCCGFLLWAQRKSDSHKRGIIILPRSADSPPFALYQTVVSAVAHPSLFSQILGRLRTETKTRTKEATRNPRCLWKANTRSGISGD